MIIITWVKRANIYLLSRPSFNSLWMCNLFILLLKSVSIAYFFITYNDNYSVMLTKVYLFLLFSNLKNDRASMMSYLGPVTNVENINTAYKTEIYSWKQATLYSFPMIYSFENRVNLNFYLHLKNMKSFQNWCQQGTFLG